KIYPSFSDFYGMEDTIERIAGYFRYASQGLEERKQILYLLGPVGGGKSSLAERLKKLMEQRPIYTLKVGNQISPIFESPLGLFLQRRLEPDHAGSARIRRNVQGTHQGPAPVADGNTGRQLQRHREFRRLPLSGHRCCPLQRIGMAAVQEQQEQ